MEEGIETDQIQGAEGGALRPAHRRAGDRIDFFYAEPGLHHLAQGDKQAVGADAVGDEVRRILGEDHALAEPLLGKAAHGGDCLRLRQPSGDDLEQFHVARRVKKMRPQEMLAEGAVQMSRHRLDRDAGRIRADDRILPPPAGDLAEHLLLHIQSFRDGFDDPVGILDLGEIILHIARVNAGDEGFIIERSGLRFPRRCRCRAESVSHCGDARVSPCRISSSVNRSGTRSSSSPVSPHSPDVQRWPLPSRLSR